MEPYPVHRLVLIVSGLLCALVLMPVLESGIGFHGLGGLSRAAFAKVCHQDPGRSFHVMGATLPVCARCTGIYLGFFIAWAAWGMAPLERRTRPVSSTLLFAGISPLVIDGLLNLSGILYSPAWLRAVTGFIFAAVAARGLWPALPECSRVLRSRARLMLVRSSNTIRGKGYG